MSWTNKADWESVLDRIFAGNPSRAELENILGQGNVPARLDGEKLVQLLRTEVEDDDLEAFDAAVDKSRTKALLPKKPAKGPAPPNPPTDEEREW